MKNSKPQARRFSKKQIVLFAILGIAIVLVGLWGWNQVAPRPLGDRLEYLGKEDYGSPLGLDYSPYSVYFYGTDMSIDEIDDYFSGANRTDDSTGTETWRKTFYLQTSEDKKIFFTLYDRDSFFERKSLDHLSTNRKYILSITDSDYNTAKNAL